jgi:phospholipid transport system substrate-binding protein
MATASMPDGLRTSGGPRLILLVALAFAGNATAQSPLETVTTTVDSVIAVLQSADMTEETQKRQVKGIISRHFDFRAMSSRVLATNWKKATKRQRGKFTSLFKELLSNTYWRKISGYEDETVEYVGERIRNNRLATVNTVIKTASVDIPVDYKLYRKDDGHWYAYDIVIEQVSLVRNYRGSFQKIVHDVGIDGLIKQLETKVARSSLPEDEQ